MRELRTYVSDPVGWRPLDGSAPGPLPSGNNPPSAVSGLTATPATTSVALRWTAATDDTDIPRYVVMRDGVVLTPTPIAQTFYTANGLAPSTGYAFSVYAVDSLGALGPSSGVSVATNATPPGDGGGFPDATNTGYAPGTTFVTKDGPSFVTTAGATYTGIHFINYVNVTQNNVTFRNCWFTSTGDYVTLDDNGHSNMLVEDCTFDGPALTTHIIASTGAVLRRCNITESQADGVRLNPFASMYDCYIHDFGFIAGAHQDGAQFNEQPHHIVVDHCRFVMSHNATSSIIMSGGGTSAPCHDMTITNNLLDGGGYAIYAQNSKPGGATAGSYNVVITGNVFTRNYDYGPVAFWENGPGNVWSGNTFSDNGATVPPA